MTTNHELLSFIKPIRQTKDYALIVSVVDTGRSYQIVNRITAVVEHNPTLLSVALEVLDTMQVALDSIRDEQAFDDFSNSLVKAGLTD